MTATDPAKPDALNAGMNPANLFIRLQVLKNQCWQAHIGKRPDRALEIAALMEATAKELKEALSK